MLLPLAIPSTDQLTAVLVEPDTEAVKAWVAPGARLAVPGLTATLTEVGALTVTAAEALLVVSAWLLAATLWFPAEAGAV